MAGGDRSTDVPNRWKRWMTAYGAAVMTRVVIVLGARYVGDAVSGPASR
ncbi:hypothetical protein [Streptomyces sp. NPDC006997]